MTLTQTLLPGAIVDPPPVLPALHNLVASAITPTEDNSRWEGGLQWRSFAGGEAHGWDPIDQGDKDTNGSHGFAAYMPFVVAIDETCSAVSGWTEDEYRRRAQMYLDAATPKAVESEFWTATLRADNFSLTGSTPNQAADATGGIVNRNPTTAPVPLSPRHALAALNQALADCGAGTRGMIHATPYLAELWGGYLELEELTADSLDRVPGVTKAVSLLTTKTRGTIVVPGAGYHGTGPDGNPKATPDAGTVWAFASKMVTVRLGATQTYPDVIAQALNRDDNSVQFIAERAAAAVPDGVPDAWCTFAALVDIADLDELGS